MTCTVTIVFADGSTRRRDFSNPNRAIAWMDFMANRRDVREASFAKPPPQAYAWRSLRLAEDV